MQPTSHATAPGDPGRTDFIDHPKRVVSLTNLAEILLPCLDAIGAKSVVEVGAEDGLLTRELLDWSARAGAGIAAVEPAAPPALLELGERHPELELILQTSHEALRHLPRPDALILDGDHNYHTLSEELRLIEGRWGGAKMPLLALHDVGWPLARRDIYYVPERIPEEHRQPLARDAAVVPGNPGVTEVGLRYEWAAAREGGPRNGILTAIEDFMEGREDLHLAVVPAFFGLGVLWHTDASWKSAVADIVGPWDRNPVVERLEANRVAQLIERLRCAHHLSVLRREQERHARQEHLLRTMLQSRAFALAERLSRLRQGGRPLFSREQVEEALGEQEGDWSRARDRS